MDDSLHLIALYFKEWSFLFKSNPRAALGKKVRELEQTFNLWKLGEQKLDQKLALAPTVRRQMLSIVMPCIWELRQGLPLYRLSMQDTLHEQTDRIMEQAANLNGYVPPKEKDFSPTNDTEFIATGYRSFQFLVDNLLEMAPTLGSLFENSESLNAQLRQEHNSDVGMASKLYVSWESFNQTIRGLRPRKQRKKRLLYDVKDPRSDPVSARSSSKRSSGSADFSIVSSVFTRNGNNSSGQPTTDTLTTTSTSHPHDPQRDTDPLANFAPLQIIMIQDCSHQTDEAHLGLFDSGTSDNFIVRDVVNKRNLQISRLPETETYQLLESIEVNVSEYVVPVWILKEGHIRREKYRFFVVNSLPDGLHMIIGKDTYDDMGISFFARRRNLVAFPTGEKGSWKGRSPQEQLNRAQQSRDGSAHWEQRQKTLEEDHAVTGRSTSSGKPPYQALHKEENSATQVKQKAASQYK